MGIIRFFVKYLFFWLILFDFQRIIFLLFHFEQSKLYSFSEILGVFYQSIRLDLSTAAYLSSIPLLFLWIPKKYYEPFFKTYTWLLIVIIAIILGIDINIYTEWGVKINKRAFEFLVHSPGEALASSSTSPVFQSVSIIILSILFSLLLFKLFKFSFQDTLKSGLKIGLIFLILACNFLLIRGGIQLSPINQSNSSFSKYYFINAVSINTEWNLLNSIFENNIPSESSYSNLEVERKEAIMRKLLTDYANSNRIFKTERPNIVFIVLESFTGDLLAKINAKESICPFLDSLSGESLFFDSLYATGDRTDKGMIGIFSGFPSQAKFSILLKPDYANKLPNIGTDLNNAGYTNSFFYGGEIEFFNFKSYILNNKVDYWKDKNSFANNEMNSKWGAHDEFVLQKQLSYLKTAKQPFFSTVLTLSLHEPFEVPFTSTYTKKTLPDLFKNSAGYVDQSLKNYFAEAKKQDWYKNTLFVIVADHGHRLPNEYENGYDPRKFRIPLFLYGDVLKDDWKKKNNHRIGSQIDIAKTILKQLNLESSHYYFSKDLLDKDPNPFAFYSFDDGWGWIDAKNEMAYDNISNQLIYQKVDTLSNPEKGQAYLQEIVKKINSLF